MIYWLIYLIFIPMLYLDITLKNKKKYKYFIVMLLILTLISGLRNMNIGGDTFTYYEIYENSPTIIELFKGEKNLPDKAVEKGFLLIFSLLKTLKINFQLVLVLISFTIIYGIMKIIEKNSIYLLTSLYFYYTLHFQLISLNAMRQGFTIALFFIFINKFKKKRIIFPLCFLLFFIHQSIIIFPIVYLMSCLNLKRYSYIFIYIFSILISRLNIVKVIIIRISNLSNLMLIRKISNYTVNDYTLSNMFYIKNTVIIIFFMYLYLEKYSTNKNKYIFKLYFWGIIFKYILSFSDVISFRLTYPFFMLNIILFSNIYEVLKKNMYKKLILFILFIGLGGIAILKTYYPNGIAASKYIPYKFFWNN